MKIIATKRCQLDGRIYDVGQALEYEGPITSRVAYNFRAADGSALTADGTKAVKIKEVKPKSAEDEDAAKIKATLNVMNRDQLIAKLDELGVAYKANARTDFLAKLLLRQQGAID